VELHFQQFGPQHLNWWVQEGVLQAEFPLLLGCLHCCLG
jgi:hypothetical protein